MRIHSRDNQLVKLIRSLRLREHREAERAFVVEGFRAVEDAISADGVARFVVVRDGESIPDWISDAQLRIFDVGLFEFVAETKTPQGILAVFDAPHLPIPSNSNPLFLILDAIADPGNLGAIIRTSAAAGVDALFLGPGCVDWLNSKVARAAMGAHFRLPVAPWDAAIEAMVVERCPLIALSDGEAESTHDRVDWTQGAALIVGSEANGASPEFRKLANVEVSIPMAGGVESLNAAIAAGVILFEAQRQRRN